MRFEARGSSSESESNGPVPKPAPSEALDEALKRLRESYGQYVAARMEEADASILPSDKMEASYRAALFSAASLSASNGGARYAEILHLARAWRGARRRFNESVPDELVPSSRTPPAVMVPSRESELASKCSSKPLQVRRELEMASHYGTLPTEAVGRLARNAASPRIREILASVRETNAGPSA